MIKKLEKKIKQTIYGKPQAIKLIYPPGFSDTALAETKSIIDGSWFPQKYKCNYKSQKNFIKIENIHMLTCVELLVRNKCLSDLRLIIYEGKAFGKITFTKKCQTIKWMLYLSKNMKLKVKVNSIASNAFHETGLKQILTDIVKEYVNEIVEVEENDAERNDTLTCLHAELYKDRLTLSISLAGALLFKRGYRSVLSASAPLREDIASCCIATALQFSFSINHKLEIDTLIIPFSGTGTFAFEYLLYHYHIAPMLLSRHYALQTMPLFKHEHFNFILKKAKQVTKNKHIKTLNTICIDTSSDATTTFKNNFETYKTLLDNHNLNSIININKDFFTIPINELIRTINKDAKHIFIPLNPPYGIRLGKNNNTLKLYKSIANKINEIINIMQQGSTLSGFILCSSEETWSMFIKTLNCKNYETYHITQGGLDVRVCQFYIHCL